MNRFSMPADSIKISMRGSQLTRSLLLIYLINMLSMLPTIQTYNRLRGRAGARALHVGIGEHAQHAIADVRKLLIRYVRHLHAEIVFTGQHVSGCQTKRNLLRVGAIETGATVPLIVFTALHRKFYDTLTPRHRCACAVPACFAFARHASNFY